MDPTAAMDRADQVATIYWAVYSVESTAIFITGTRATTLPTVAMVRTEAAADRQAIPIRATPTDQAVEVRVAVALVPMYQRTAVAVEVRAVEARGFITQR